MPAGPSDAERDWSREDVLELLHGSGRSNWGRWGSDDEVGALNLVTERKRASAAAEVRSGRTVSLSRPFPSRARPGVVRPASHYTTSTPRGTGGIAGDYYGIEYHGIASTHVDALCHVWDERGMWQGRDPAVEVTSRGSRWGSVHRWRQGIVTRGVLLDVPAFRGEPYVTFERPVHGDELVKVAEAQGVAVEPGDAVLVHSGRDRWDLENPVWGTERTERGEPRRPGLHASCLRFLSDSDCAVLGWDMLDHAPNDWGIPWTVHGSVFAYGLALVDNCDLAPLAAACAAEGRYTFMFVVAPLVVEGGTGSPANPLAVL
ncbi:cyclase family protein [Streptomyces sp. NRRL F-5126]|uniref:cyclase family protein n=1 Tax=Streptomyces sp. NRRL F-5126 TaxID=1463857 RepID=UPI0006918186|nr:cyclase family protein [Streptomyces sp. NRRL F-5126]